MALSTRTPLLAGDRRRMSGCRPTRGFASLRDLRSCVFAGDRRRMALSGAILLMMTACTGAATTPEETFRRFLQDLDNGRKAQAFRALSKDSQNEIKNHTKQIAEATGLAPDKPEDYLLNEGEMMLLRRPESISVTSPLSGDEVILLVTVEGGKNAEIKMVREGTAWKVDLFKSLEAFPNYGIKAETSTAAPVNEPEP